MKSIRNLLEQLKPLPRFTKSAVHQFGEQLGLKNATVDVYISRFLKSKEIFQLKKGLYVTADFFNKNKDDASYSFYLANVIRTPSYVSSWAALQYYDLATEAIHSVTSITPKVTRHYETKAGNFEYQSIKRELFSGFSLMKGKFDFFIATPSKALFDLLYFKTHQFRGTEYKEIKTLIEELRIDIDEMDKEEQKKFYSIIKNYFHE
jgi:predicted transcriptional regulator of viral defense system